MQLKSLTFAISILALSAPALADGHIEQVVKDRITMMEAMGAANRVVGAMARGRRDYDADAAQKAAADLLALTQTDQSMFWPEGSDNFDMGTATRATPEIWDNMEDFQARTDALAAAVEALVPVAGDGLEALQGAFRAVGGACSGCHKLYRGPEL